MGAPRGEQDPGETGETPERSRAAMRAGRMLMQWKTKEDALPGQAEENYELAVRQLQEGVSESVLREEVPPGYHEAIRKYFDDLGEKKKSSEGGDDE